MGEDNRFPLNIHKLEPWQKRKLFSTFFIVVLGGLLYLFLTCTSLYQDKVSERDYWASALTPSPEEEALAQKKSVAATSVTAGTYIENMKELSLKTSSFRTEFLVWFRWEGQEELDMMENFHIYKGTVHSKEIMKEYHKDGVNYQLARIDATVSKNFWTNRFPLESHQLHIYLESDYPVEEVMLIADKENSGLNRNLSINGYELVRHEIGTYLVTYDNARNDPEYSGKIINSELVVGMEINRNSWGLYAKCFIALMGTISWVMITLFINTFHTVDPLLMIPAALFGTVTNIMVGANLLPDTLTLGLLEYVNLYGIMTILTVALIIIQVNRIRNKWADKPFAKLYGQVMFYTILILTVLGNLALPLTAYL
ncbi:MAG: hypothetical protein RRX92_07660 [Lachnospiraceae bacterium]